jgi:hypothetical protein
LRIWKSCGWFISGPTSRIGRTSTCEPGLVVESLLQLDPAFLAAGLVARQDGFTQRILDALQVNLDRVADLDVGGHARHGEFLEGDAALGLQADIDHGEVVLDGDDGALDDGAFLRALGLEALFQHRGEIFAAGGGNGFGLAEGCGARHADKFLYVVHAKTAATPLDFPGWGGCNFSKE